MKKYKGDKIWENNDYIVSKFKSEIGIDILNLFYKNKKKWWYAYRKIEFCVIGNGNYINILPDKNGFVSEQKEIPLAVNELLKRHDIDPNNREYMINQINK